MRYTTLLLALAALAATSCSLQLDSQYGMRWEPRVSAQRHSEAEPERAKYVASSGSVAEEFQKSASWSDATLRQVDGAASLAAPLMVEDEVPSAPIYHDVGEEPSAVTYPASDAAEHRATATNDRAAAKKNVLDVLLGTLLILIGVGLLTLGGLAVVIIAAYGAEVETVLFTILIFALGIAAIILGRRLGGRF